MDLALCCLRSKVLVFDATYAGPILGVVVRINDTNGFHAGVDDRVGESYEADVVWACAEARDDVAVFCFGRRDLA